MLFSLPWPKQPDKDEKKNKQQLQLKGIPPQEKQSHDILEQWSRGGGGGGQVWVDVSFTNRTVVHDKQRNM